MLRTRNRNKARRQGATTAAAAIRAPLGYDLGSGFPARRDHHGQWRWITFLPGPALTEGQVADIVEHRAHRPPARADLPALGIDPVSGYAAYQHDLGGWSWLTFTDSAPLSLAQVDDLVLYRQIG